MLFAFAFYKSHTKLALLRYYRCQMNLKINHHAAEEPNLSFLIVVGIAITKY